MTNKVSTKLIILTTTLAVGLAGCGQSKQKTIQESNVDKTAQKNGKIQEIPEEKNKNPTEIIKEHKSYGSYEEKNGKLYFIIEEMGIKLPINKEAKDQVVYYYKKKNYRGEIIETVYFSTKAAACSAKLGPYAAIGKHQG
ncbi:MAG: hypothetical protein GF335_02235 [Candidatus Moranbacteria bacterium]|nr:hypothetical protein [Candidatus Moranbacteria bacterium]